MFIVKNRRNSRKAESALIKNEKILHSCEIHGGIFFFSFLIGVAAVLAGAFFHMFLGALILFLGFFYFANALILYMTTELVLTNKRVLAYYGVFVTDLMQIGHEKLESAHIEQNLLGSLLGFKTITVKGTGQGSIPIPYIADAEIFKRHLDEILFGDKENK